MPWPLLAVHTLLIAALGTAMEIVFTALADLPRAGDRRLKGYSYVWMIPIYALVYPLLCFLYPSISGRPWAARGLFYTAIAYALEYSSGWILRAATGEAPWEREYRGARWAVHGLIRLDFAPAWFGAGLLFELVFRVLRGLA